MRKTLKSSTRFMVLLLAGGGLLLTGCASVRAPAYLPHGYSTATARLSPEMQSDFTSSPNELLRRFERYGRLYLSLNDCLLIASHRSHDILLTQEALSQAEEKITQARAAMLPFLGAEASYARLDKELSFAMGPQSLTFMDRDLY
jgi:outer membrane protein